MPSKKPKDTGSKAGNITRNLTLGADRAEQVRGGSKPTVGYQPQKPDGSLDAGIRFKYDLKG